MDRVIGREADGELEVKRLYLPGIKVESKCESCEDSKTLDLGDDYLSFPTLNKPEDVHFYCEKCNIEWDVPVILTLTVELA